MSGASSCRCLIITTTSIGWIIDGIGSVDGRIHNDYRRRPGWSHGCCCPRGGDDDFLAAWSANTVYYESYNDEQHNETGNSTTDYCYRFATEGSGYRRMIMPVRAIAMTISVVMMMTRRENNHWSVRAIAWAVAWMAVPSTASPLGTG